MANALPDLVINIAANTATLTDGITKATAQISGFGKSATSSLGAIEGAATLATRALGALGVGFSVIGVAHFVKDTVDAAAALQALSSTTGSSVEELSRLSNVAAVTGTSFDTFQTLLSKMTVGLAGVGEGSSASAKALQFLGVTAKDPAEALQQVADKMATFADDASKAALARDLFGKNGPEFIDTLKRMADAHDVLSTRTAEDARAANEFNEQLRLLSIQGTVLKDSILRDIIPGMTAMIEEFNKARAAGLGFWDSLNTATTPSKINEHIDDLTGKIATLQKQLANVVPGTPNAANSGPAQARLATYTAQLNILLGVLQKLTPAQQAWKDALGKLAPSSGYTGATASGDDAAAKAAADYVAQLQKEAAQLGLTDIAVKALALDSLPKLTAAQKTAGLAALNAINTYNTQAQAAKDYYASIDAGIKAYEDGLKASSDANDAATKSTQSLLDALQTQVATYGLTDTEAQRYSLQQQLNAEMTAGHADAVANLTKALTLLDQLEGKIAANDYAKAQADAAEQAARAVDQAARNMERSLEDALVDAFENGGKNAARDFERWLTRTMAQLVLRPILAPITQGLASSILGGGGAGAGGASAGGGAGSLSSLGSLGSLAGFAGTGAFGTALGAGGSAGLATLGIASSAGAEAVGGIGAVLGAGGAVLGAALPYIGIALAIASASGLLNKSPSEVSGQFGVTTGTGGFEDNAFTKSPFGNLGFLDSGTQQFSGQAAQAFNQVVSGALAAFATRLTTSQQGDLASRLQSTSFAGASGTFTTEDFLQKYGATVLKQVIGEAFDELNPAMAALARNFQGTADEVTSFSNGLLALYDITNKLPTSIQSGLVAALDETQDTLTRITALAGAYKAVQDALNADPIADAQAAVEASTNSLSLAFTQQGTALDALVAKFDGSADAATALAQATSSYYAAEVQLLAGLKQASASISDSFAETARGIKLSTLDTKGQGDFLADEMNSLFASLLKATDPAQIQSLADRINQDVNQSFSLLSPDEQKQRAQEYLDYVDKANAAAQAHIDEVQQQVQQQANNEYSKLRDMLTDVVSKLNDAGATQQAAANTQLVAAKTPITVVVADARSPEVNGGG